MFPVRMYFVDYKQNDLGQQKMRQIFQLQIYTKLTDQTARWQYLTDQVGLLAKDTHMIRPDPALENILIV